MSVIPAQRSVDSPIIGRKCLGYKGLRRVFGLADGVAHDCLTDHKDSLREVELYELDNQAQVRRLRDLSAALMCDDCGRIVGWVAL